MVETIRDRLWRSATYKEAYGGFSNEKFKGITVINRLEEAKPKEIINEIDPKSFATIYDVAEGKDGNFRKHNIH